jgi:hypothetical protein
MHCLQQDSNTKYCFFWVHQGLLCSTCVISLKAQCHNTKSLKQRGLLAIGVFATSFRNIRTTVHRTPDPKAAV